MTKPPANALELPLHVRGEMALKAAVEKVSLEHARQGLHVPVTPSRQQPSAPSRRVRAMATRGRLPVALSWLPVANHHPPTTSVCPFDCLASPLDKLSMAIPVVRCRLEQQFPRRRERRDSAARYPRQQGGQHTPRFLFSEQS